MEIDFLDLETGKLNKRKKLGRLVLSKNHTGLKGTVLVMTCFSEFDEQVSYITLEVEQAQAVIDALEKWVKAKS